MSAALLARAVLGLVFAVAGAGKLRDLRASRDAAERLGAPRRLAPAVGVLLPVAELAVAAGCIPRATAVGAAIAGAALLVLFSLAVAVALRRGVTGECRCFGSVATTPIGGGLLARNGVLIGVAAVAATVRWTGGAELGWSAAVVAAVAVQSVFLWQLFLQNGRLVRRLDALEQGSTAPAAAGLPIGEPAPPFVLGDLDGDLVALDDLLAEQRGALLVFTDPSCGHCTPLLPAVAAAQAEHLLPVALISSGDLDLNRATAEEHGIAQVLLQVDAEVSDLYRVYGSPSAVLVGDDGRIATERAEGLRAVRELLARVEGVPVG